MFAIGVLLMAVAVDPPGAGLIEYIPTSDGGSVAVKRRPTPGGTPVVFVHGLAVNADLWDLPDCRTDEFEYRSLASLLHELGYDIWLVNLRGHGAPNMYSAPPGGQTDWCVDHFILYDMPAVVDRVRAETGRRPFLIGASMGSMTIAGYLQGATLVGPPEKERIIADEALAAERQQTVAGCVLVEFPAALRWPQSLYREDGGMDWQKLWNDWRRGDPAVNYPFEVLSRLGWLQAVIESLGRVPLDWLRSTPVRDYVWSRLPAAWVERLEKAEKTIVQSLLGAAGTFTGATHHRAEVMVSGRRFVIDDMKAGVLRQLAKSVRCRGFVSELGVEDYVYSDHYDAITLPTLVIAGGRDRIANAGVVRDAFYERISSEDKEFLLFDDIAHGEFEAAPVATRVVYPEIIRWIAGRMDGAHGQTVTALRRWFADGLQEEQP